MYLIVARQLLIMSLVALCSFFFSKRIKCSDSDSKFLSNLLLFFISPAIILNAFNRPFDSETSRTLLIVMGLAFLSQIVISIIGEVFVPHQAIGKLAVVYSNAGFIGIPLIRSVLNEDGVFLLIGYIMVYNLYLWTHGYFLVTNKINLKAFFKNPTVISIFAGLVLFVSPLKLPPIVHTAVGMVADINTAVSMILLGVLLAHIKRPEKGDLALYARLFRVVILRLVASPLAIIALAATFRHFFPSIPSMSAMILVIVAACPVGMTAANFAVLYDKKDEAFASLCVSVSSVFCVFTIPLIVRLASFMLPA